MLAPPSLERLSPLLKKNCVAVCRGGRDGERQHDDDNLSHSFPTILTANGPNSHRHKRALCEPSHEGIDYGCETPII